MTRVVRSLLVVVIISDNIGRHFANIITGADEGGNRYDTRIYKKFGNLSYATYIFYTVGFRKTQIIINTATDIVSIQNTAKQSPLCLLYTSRCV